MTKAELENKHLGELHSLAAAAGVERYRMLPKAELIAKLADDGSGSGRQSSGGRQSSPASGGGEQRERPPRRRRRSGSRAESGEEGRAPRSGRAPRGPREAEPTPEPAAEAPAPPAAAPTPSSDPSDSSARPKRRRRRRFGRRGKQDEGVTLQGLLLPPESGRQALLCAETRAGCTALLRGIAADLSAESDGPDPVVLLIDPSPEELADWRRDAPRAEIVAAGQPRHASDALAQASARAGSGDDVILLVDSLTRLAEAYEEADAAKKFFDAGRTAGGSGSLTVVAALERPAAS